MSVTIEDIKKLRKMTGAGLSDCKNALNETAGDFEKAIEIIRAKGKAVAAKRSDREAAEGCVLAAHSEGFAAIVSLQCETDFVAKNEGHIALTQQILDVAMKEQPASKEELLKLPLADGRAVAEHITDRIGSTGEKMELGNYEFLKAPYTTSYIHFGNKLAAIVAFNEAIDEEMAREIAMQVASMNPVAVCEKDVPAHILEEERKVAMDRARESGKPEAICERIVEGSIQKFYKENTLLHQPFVRDNKMDVQGYLHTASKTLTATGFKRVNLNED
ncbi:translation elongation factor Ts [uncultured Porphyromonas sp.]|jgi:elongation factor Ts|uniref:translation elongation factor Ts n=1 Tax=uncultured Porphyromonas sp. TaxID=159274 RepID=UPI00261917C0|nr:translation elongation factor Ts [uncultured Porphyromonas sp.]